MKKFFILVILAILCIFNMISGLNINDSDIEHEIYIPNDSYDIVSHDIKVVHTGSFDIVKVKNDKYQEIRDSLDKVYGESVTLSGSRYKLNKIVKKLDIEILSRDRIGDKEVITGHSDKIDIHSENNVNIEIAFGNNQIEIGTPLIMGDY